VELAPGPVTYGNRQFLVDKIVMYVDSGDVRVLANTRAYANGGENVARCELGDATCMSVCPLHGVVDR
jgi:hypothetical protein